MPLFSPHYHINEVAPRRLQARLKAGFRNWGLPKAIRVDNGKPLGDPQRASVPELALWLLGLGVEVIWNAPRSPRANAKVERMQATTAAWAEVQSCADCGQLQKRLHAAARLQREKYGVRRLGGKSRRQVYAALWNNPRTYHRDHFALRRVYQYLSEVCFKRKVNKKGCFTFYAQNVYVGPAHREKTVSITFDICKKHFVVSDEHRGAFACFAADNFNASAIQTLNVCRHRTLKCRNLLSQKSGQT
jgi:hypothetical protein